MRWQHFKDSWNKSKKPFETVTGKLAFPISIIAGLVGTHCLTENWGNFMTWWALAIPGIVWLIYFVWNLANFHHRVHKDRTPALITILLFVVVSFAILLAVQIQKNIANQSNQPKPTILAAKSLPDTIDINTANWTKHDRDLFQSAQEIGEIFSRSMSSGDYSKAASCAEEDYVKYFELAQDHPECWQKVEGSSSSLARVCVNLANRKDESNLADEVTTAINHPHLNSDVPKPAVDLFNKLKSMYPN